MINSCFAILLMSKSLVTSKVLNLEFFLCPPHIIFAFSAVCLLLFIITLCFRSISRKSIYPIFTKFGMGVYWVISLHGIAFGEDSCVAN